MTAGNRMRGMRPFGDTTYWQYDGVARLVGSARRHPDPYQVNLHLDACRWHPSGKLGQPCGNGGSLGFVGENVTRSSLGWFFVHAPGIDEVLLLVHRYGDGAIQARLQAVTDGRGQLLAIADSTGFISSTYAGSGYDQAAWQGAGLTSRAQTYDPRRWETGNDWGGVQQFRHRAYDPATGTWIQEDPLGVAGGVNVYRFNNGNPVSFSDPMGLCPPRDDNYSDCEPGTSGWYGNRVASCQGNRILNEVGGTFAACGESLACTAVLALAGPIGNTVAGVASALRTAATSTGRVSIKVGSVVEASAAGRAWVGVGSRVITSGRGAGGDVIGRISADATRVYRHPIAKVSGPNAGKTVANLVRKLPEVASI